MKEICIRKLKGKKICKQKKMKKMKMKQRKGDKKDKNMTEENIR